MKFRKLGQSDLSSRRERYIHIPPIIWIVILAYETLSHSTSHEFDHRVVPLLEKLGEIGDRGASGSVVARNPQEQLVLLRCKPLAYCSALAEAKELAQLIPK